MHLKLNIGSYIHVHVLVHVLVSVLHTFCMVFIGIFVHYYIGLEFKYTMYTVDTCTCI